MTTLSSEVLAAVQCSASPGAQQKSVGRAVCPDAYDEVEVDGLRALGRTAVYEHQLRRTVLLVVRRLLDTDLR